MQEEVRYLFKVVVVLGDVQVRQVNAGLVVPQVVLDILILTADVGQLHNEVTDIHSLFVSDRV
jgi:hypothetical protein